MKTNCISDVTKIVIFAATVIVICVLCAVGFKTANEGKSTVSTGSSQFNQMASEYSNVDKAVYDNCTILGSELVSLIKKTVDKNDYLSLVVITLESSRTDYNYLYNYESDTISEGGTKNIETNKGRGSYINTTAQFHGTVKKDKNNNIICIWFEQLP